MLHESFGICWTRISSRGGCIACACMSRRICLRIVTGMARHADGGENRAREAVSICGFPPFAYGEIERGGERAGVWEMRESLRARAQLCAGDHRLGRCGSGDGDDREFGGAR